MTESLMTEAPAEAEAAPAEGGTAYPDYMPEKFHNGTVDEAHAKLGESYASLNKEFTQRNQSLEGINQELFGAPKNDAGDVEYAVNMPEAFQDKFEVDAEAAQPLLDYAKENGMSQKFVDEAYSMFMHSQADVMGDPESTREAEMASLGPDAADRIEKLNTWATANLDETQRGVLEGIATTAAEVELIEGLINKSRNSPLPKGDVTPAATHTQEEYAGMLNAKDEWGQSKMRDPEYANKTNQYAASLDAQNKLHDMKS